MRISDWSSDVCSSDLRAAALLRFVADIDLDEQARLLSGLFAGARERADERGAVDRVDGVEQRHRLLRLVRLELADQVEGDVGRRFAQRGPFGGGFLDAILDRKSTRLNSSH